VFTINTLAKGLLGILGAPAGGRTPPAFAEEFVRPVIEVGNFLAADYLRVAAVGAPVIVGDPDVSVTLIVPDGFFWLVYKAAAAINYDIGGGRLALEAGGIPASVTGTPESMFFSATTRQVAAGPAGPWPHRLVETFSPPLLLQPGMSLTASVSDSVQSADTVLALTVLVAEVRTP